ncbi:MAG: protein translocase subunit SecF [Beutenbergiaceae bacterium]
MASFAAFGNDLYSGKRNVEIIGRRRRWFTISAVLLLASVLLLFVRGINPGIEFRGGSEFTISGTSDTSQQPALDAVEQISTGQEPRVSSVGDDGVRVQTQQLSDSQTSELRELLAVAYDVDITNVTSNFVGPQWGQDVTSQALRALIIFLVLVSIVMALYFRRWTMAAAAVVALLHDLVITVGLYAGVGFEVTPATVIGFLTILGYSLYDTVVVFDKVRENTEGVLDQTRYTYGEASNLAVNQTLVRSINTSVLAILPVAAILFVGALLLGAGTLRDISLALFIGMIFSTLSSVFIAAPIEVWFRERNPVIAAHTAKVKALREQRLTQAKDSGEDTDAALAGARAGGLVAGSHQGQAAQPRRKRRS